MVSKEKLVSCFSNVNCSIESNDAVEKCLELCSTYDLDEEMLVEFWLAYCVPRYLNIHPTVEVLRLLENEDLKKNYKKVLKAIPFSETNVDVQNVIDMYSTDVPSTSSMQSYLVLLRKEEQSRRCWTYEKSKLVCHSKEASPAGIHLAVLGSYIGASTSRIPGVRTRGEASLQDLLGTVIPARKILQSKRLRSPGTETTREHKRFRAIDSTPPTASVPTTKSNPPSTPARGKVLLNFGPEIESWEKREDNQVSICKSASPHVPSDAVYMHEMLSKQGAILTVSCESFGEHTCILWTEKENAPSKTNMHYVKNVTSVSQVAFRTLGRISTILEKTTGKKIVSLEGCTRLRGRNNAPTIRLDLGGLERYSIFPGQIVGVEGINSTGNVLVAKEIFSKGYAPRPEVPRLAKPLRIYVAAGPFTPSDNLNYQPLWDLMARVENDEPEILILIGPFLEATHPEVKRGTLTDTFQGFFEKILARITRCLQGKSTRVVLVPSNRDAHHDPVYPTPEFGINSSKIGSDVSKLHAMSDPCIINVEGLHVGVTSVDCVKHLGQQEVSNTPGMDRLGRLADHVLSQATFYPLYPPFSDLNFDTTLWKKYACFQQQPHLMILPSDIRYYCKPVNECLVLNPERLQKNIYTKLLVRPATGGNWTPDSVSCEIAKL